MDTGNTTGPHLDHGHGGPPSQQPEQQHTPRYRHVSAPVQQPQNLSSFQEGMRQDSVGGNAIAMGTSTASGTRNTGHVGIIIDDHHSHLVGQGHQGHGQVQGQGQGHGMSATSTITNTSNAGINELLSYQNLNPMDTSKRADHIVVSSGPFQPMSAIDQQLLNSPSTSSFLIPPPQTNSVPSSYYHHQQFPPKSQPSVQHQRHTHSGSMSDQSVIDSATVDEIPLTDQATTRSSKLETSAPPGSKLMPPSSLSAPSDSVSMTEGHISGATVVSAVPTSVSPRASGSFSPARYTNMSTGVLGIAPSSSSPSRSPVSPVLLQKSSSLRSSIRSQAPRTAATASPSGLKESTGVSEHNTSTTNASLSNSTSPGFRQGSGSSHLYGPAQTQTLGQAQTQAQAQAKQPSTTQVSSLVPPAMSYYQSSPSSTASSTASTYSHSVSANSSPSGYLGHESMSPPTKGHANRNSHYSGMFQQGYSHAQYQGQLPGATLSRHLSIQLSPNATLLPPPPALHSHGHSGQALHSAYTMEPSSEGHPTTLANSRGGDAQSHRDHTSSASSTSSGVAPPSLPFPAAAQQSGQARIPPSSTSTSSSTTSSYQPQQQYHQHHQYQSQSIQHQHGGVPPPTTKYIRSPMMPQLSSQAMAFAQAQSQSQYRNQRHSSSSSYQHYSSPPSSHQQQLPPRTHRRSIQPLTLEQQQPKGGPFRYVRNQADMWPQKGSQKYRSIDGYGHSVSPLRALTELLTSTYSHCNRDFKYEPSYNPRRVLTKPSKPMHNEGYDNEDYDYILYVSDILGSEERQRYLILDVLGQGTFGQVVKCQNLKTNAIVAVKVIKNKPAYFNQSMMEVTVLELLNERYDVDDRHHILRLQDTFIHRRHLCLVFELLSVNLYELIKQNQFRGLSMSLVRVFTAQLLDALCVLNEARIIHCDLKPENVLLKNLETPTIKVIDFGSACHEQQTVYTYIQSRFYRSPEVLVGLPYSSSIDIWSVGCIAAELFLGLPLFPGSSEYNQLSRIVEMLGMLPTYMLEIGKTAHEFFEQVRQEPIGHSFSTTTAGPKKYRLKSMETYSRQHNVVEQPSKRYFQATTLPDIVNSYPMIKKGMTQKEVDKETMIRLSFINFLQGLLNLNPIERWSPHQAKLHPFITGEPFLGNFIPPTIPKKPQTAENSSRLEPTLPGRSSKTRSASLTSSSSTSMLSGVKPNSGSAAVAASAAVATAVAASTTASSRQSQGLTASSQASSKVNASSSLNAAEGEFPGHHGLGLPPLFTLEGTATASGSSLGSSATGGSSINGSPLATPPSSTSHQSGSGIRETIAGPGSGLTAHFADSPHEADNNLAVQTLSALPASHHQQHRPRATTMGTVDVPKNMAQLAAVITPQQGQSNSSHRMAPKDMGMHTNYGSPNSSAGGSLRQIPERSEQNSPVSEGLLNGDQGLSSVSPHTSQPPLHHQQPKYLLRSGSDSTGKVMSHRRASAGRIGERHGGFGSGTGGSSIRDSYRRQDYGPSITGAATLASTTTAEPELTPLQRMQQQLIMGQAQNKQQQERYHFGYPQSGSSLSESGSGSGFDSNNSSRLEEEDEDEDDDGGHGTEALEEASQHEEDDGDRNVDGGDDGYGLTEGEQGLRHLDIARGDHSSKSSTLRETVGQSSDGPDGFSRNNNSRSNSGAGSPSGSSATGTSSLYSRSYSSTSMNRSVDNDSPFPSSTANLTTLSSMAGESSTGVETGAFVVNSGSSSGSSLSHSLQHASQPLPTGASAVPHDDHSFNLIAQDQVNDGDDEDSSREAHSTALHVATAATRSNLEELNNADTLTQADTSVEMAEPVERSESRSPQPLQQKPPTTTSAPASRLPIDTRSNAGVEKS
ncbi:CMGC/DYRK/YAK protein kinase [Podila verticillata NRRL 6337]|nr:CMGC/DYRK/YAK protein kinase [Podila verticillata NRRL 6337]